MNKEKLAAIVNGMLIGQVNCIKFLYVDKELSRKYLIHQISTKRPKMTGQMGEASSGEDSQCAVEKSRSTSEVITLLVKRCNVMQVFSSPLPTAIFFLLHWVLVINLWIQFGEGNEIILWRRWKSLKRTPCLHVIIVVYMLQAHPTETVRSLFSP